MTKEPSFSVEGMSVLISGGAGGVGKEFANGFLNHGSTVIVADIAEPTGDVDPRVRYECLDVTSDDAVAELALQDAAQRVSCAKADTL